MEIKKLETKKGVKIIDIFMVLLVGIFAFTGIFLFIQDNAEESGIEVDARYTDAFNNLSEEQEDIDELAKELRDSVQDIKEADNAAQVAWNGMKGILAIFKLPLEIWDTAKTSFEIGLSMLDTIPAAPKAVILIALTVILVFAFLRFITQRGNDA
jgi:hypothetical protein